MITTTMDTDKKIKEFFHSVRPPVNDSEAFLREFERQSALLPQPASMTESEDLEKAERLQKLYSLASHIRKVGRTEAAITAISAMAGCLLLFILAVSAMSSILPTLGY